jgi:hypothetical protein
VSRKSTNARASGCDARERISPTEFGSAGAAAGAGPRAGTNSNDDTVCGALSSKTSKSSAVRSVRAIPFIVA